MKVHLLSENLQKKISFTGKAISQRSSLPILLNFLIETKDGKIQISSTDLEIGIKINIPASIEEEGQTTVPAKTFLELINSLPSGKITFETKENNLYVKTPVMKTVFQTLNKDEFPKLFEEKGVEIISTQKEIIQKELLKVVFAASIDTTRPALSGVLIRKKEEYFIVVATDGYRLSLKKIKININKTKEEDIEDSMLISARAIKEFLSLKDGEEVKIFISKKNNQVIFEQNGTILVGRLIDAEFPNYEKIIPSSFTTKTIFNKEEMQKAIKISSIFARESANVIKFSINEKNIVVSANTPSVGENTIDVEAKTEGEDNEIAFNSRFLLDLFNNVDAEEMVFEMSDSLSPGVFRVKDDTSFFHLIMPIRIQN